MLAEIKLALKETYLEIANNYSVGELNHDGDKVACVASAFRESAVKRIEAIIRSHSSNDGWIPCNRELPGEWYVDPDLEPEDIVWPEYNVTIRDASEATTLHYDFQEGTWFDDNGNIYDVVAWRPMPGAYCPKQKCVGEDYRQHVMERFLKTE